MSMTQTRRRFLTTWSIAGAAGLLRPPRVLAAEPPLMDRGAGLEFVFERVG
jgi:hypothetical protein